MTVDGSVTSIRRKRHHKGLWGERYAAAALRLRGYRILEQRWKTPVGEVDLIALRGNRIAFVEVKRRKTRLEAEAAITDALRRRVRRSANVWISQNAKFQSYDIGFDLIFVLPWRWPQHFQDSL